MGDVRFDISAAENLIKSMSTYCGGIQKEARDTLNILEIGSEWNDRQLQAFQANMMVIAKDLDGILSLESDYMRTYYQRIQELRG